MFDPETLPEIRKSIRDRAQADQKLLAELRSEVQSLIAAVRAIKPRSTTSISLVASDGGNNKLMFDPFYVQLVRVVDSFGKELALDAISPTTDTDVLSAAQFDAAGEPKTALGRMMKDLGVKTLYQLSPMIPNGETTRTAQYKVSPSWVLVYRDLCEWAVLYERICYTTFATDTLIVRDGLLRSKLFAKDLFIKYREKITEAIQRIERTERRKIYLVGLAKHSKVLQRYQLALAIENVFPAGEPKYVKVPRELEAKAYVWPEYARGAEQDDEEKEAPKYVNGDMFFVRFGDKSGDPMWVVDIYSPQVDKAQEIMGYLLADSINGFPVPFYPRCLQKAHEHAEVVDFDLEILQDEVYGAVRDLLPKDKQDILEAFKLNPDPSGLRYE